MEINITEFFNTAAPIEFFASAAELGADAGAVTWAAAVTAAETQYPLLKTAGEFSAFREFAAEFGAWTETEIAEWSEPECNALLIQLISADIREGDTGSAWNWAEYDALAQAGHCTSNLFLGDDGEVYYYVGV